MAAHEAGLLLCDDLLFGSRITGTAEALGLHVRVVRTAAALLEAVNAAYAPCVLLDLHNPGLEIETVVRRLKEEPLVLPVVIGFGSHVDAATLHRAREAGCDRVLPRSQFVEELPNLLPIWLCGELGA